MAPDLPPRWRSATVSAASRSTSCTRRTVAVAVVASTCARRASRAAAEAVSVCTVPSATRPAVATTMGTSSWIRTDLSQPWPLRR